MPGTLYLVSSPIGNLGDVSARARDVLSAAGVVACEDTRVTQKLLRHLEIRGPLISYHEHNEAERTPELVARLLSGVDVALVSDAGTPLVSDPGYRLVRAAREASIDVRAVPGPSAVLAALAVSGLPPAPFTFLGFVPPKGEARRSALQILVSSPHSVVLFEAPTRIAKLLATLAAMDGLSDRVAFLAREMTKRHEEHWSGTVAELAGQAAGVRFKGELTLVIAGTGRERPPPKLEELSEPFADLRREGLTARAAARLLAKWSGVPARDIYRALAAGREELSP